MLIRRTCAILERSLSRSSVAVRYLAIKHCQCQQVSHMKLPATAQFPPPRFFSTEAEKAGPASTADGDVPPLELGEVRPDHSTLSHAVVT